MANRLMSNRVYTGQKDVKIINVVAASGGASAPTLNASKSWGVASITRVAQGKYRFALGLLRDGVVNPDVYREFQGHTVGCISPTADTASTVTQSVVVNDNSATTGLIDVWFYSPLGVLTDPLSGESMNLQFFFSDSSAP
jgi:hypothetical protein